MGEIYRQQFILVPVHKVNKLLVSLYIQKALFANSEQNDEVLTLKGRLHMDGTFLQRFKVMMLSEKEKSRIHTVLQYEVYGYIKK